MTGFVECGKGRLDSGIENAYLPYILSATDLNLLEYSVEMIQKIFF